MKTSMIFAVLFVVGLCPHASAGIFGPNSYEECIEESLKGVSSDVAARALIINCRKKFPTEEEKAKIKRDEEIKKRKDELEKRKMEYDSYIERGRRSAHVLDYDTVNRLVSGKASMSGVCSGSDKGECYVSGQITNNSKEFYITSFTVKLHIKGGGAAQVKINENVPPGSTENFKQIVGEDNKQPETFFREVGTFSWNIIEYTGFSMTGAPPMP